MPTFITLGKYTQKGIENIKEGPSRLEEAKKAFKAVGAEIKEFYLVTGEYDMVVIVEAPDDVDCCKISSHYWFKRYIPHRYSASF